MSDFNDPLPSTLGEPQLSSREMRELDEREQMLTAEAAMKDGRSDTTTYASEQMAREAETRVTMDMLEGLRKLETGDPIRWTIYRVDSADPGKLGYLAQWSTARLSQERLRDEFGAGVYRIEGNLPNGQYVKRRTVTIAEDAPRRVRESMNGSGSASGFNMQEFLAHQDAVETRRQAREEERRRRDEELEEKRRAERKEMMIALGPAALTALATIMGGNRGPDIAGLIAALKPPDPLTMLTQLKALSGSNQGLAEKLVPMLLEKVTDGAGAGGETGWMDIVKEVVKSAGPTLGGVIEASVQNARVSAASGGQGAVLASGQASATPLILLPESRAPRRERVETVSRMERLRAGSTGENSAALAGGVEMSVMALMPHVGWLKEQLARLGSAAVHGRAPGAYAAVFLEELPNGIELPTMVQLLSRPDWYQQLCQLEPRLNREDLVPWFEVLRQEVLRLIDVELGVKGGAVATAAPPAPAVQAKPAPVTGEVRRPTRLPSLTGE